MTLKKLLLLTDIFYIFQATCCDQIFTCTYIHIYRIYVCMYIHFLHIASTLGKNIHTYIYKSISTHHKLYSQRFYPRVLIIQREFFISVITIGYIYPTFISKLMFFSSNKAFSYPRKLLQTTLIFFFIMIILTTLNPGFIPQY